LILLDPENGAEIGPDGTKPSVGRSCKTFHPGIRLSFCGTRVSTSDPASPGPPRDSGITESSDHWSWGYLHPRFQPPHPGESSGRFLSPARRKRLLGWRGMLWPWFRRGAANPTACPAGFLSRIRPCNWPGYGRLAGLSVRRPCKGMADPAARHAWIRIVPAMLPGPYCLFAGVHRYPLLLICFLCRTAKSFPAAWIIISGLNAGRTRAQLHARGPTATSTPDEGYSFARQPLLSSGPPAPGGEPVRGCVSRTVVSPRPGLSPPPLPPMGRQRQGASGRLEQGPLLQAAFAVRPVFLAPSLAPVRALDRSRVVLPGRAITGPGPVRPELLHFVHGALAPRVYQCSSRSFGHDRLRNP